jgi:hypothetical protein
LKDLLSSSFKGNTILLKTGYGEVYSQDERPGIQER